jgi:hypothetical protein
MKRFIFIGTVLLASMIGAACKGKTDAVVDAATPVTTVAAAASSEAPTPSAKPSASKPKQPSTKQPSVPGCQPGWTRTTKGICVDWCEVDDDCDDDKTCQDSPHIDPDLGKIKTCQTPAAKPAAAGRTVPKCKSDENLFATAVDAPPFCAKSCNGDKDCPSHSCVSVVEVDNDGKPVRAMNGNTIADTACAPGSAAAAPAEDDCPGALNVRCKGVCVNIQTDDKNCGGCGIVCRPGTHCNIAMACRDEQGNL